MKLFAPKYYKDFACTADRCTHSCCIGWEIDIDEDTLKKYRSLTGDYADKIRDSIEHDGTPHFRLDSSERCPHLNKNGLCNIITNYGENAICQICQEHPRFYNYTSRGKEVGLGMACQEACRLILSCDNYSEIIELGEADEDNWVTAEYPLSLRKELFEILSANAPYPQRLQKIYEAYDITPSVIDDTQWKRLIKNLEYLVDSHRELFLCYSSRIEESTTDVYLERALAYFIYRHCAEVFDTEELEGALGFCLFCERLFASIAKKTGATDLNDMVHLGVMISEELEYSEDNTESIKQKLINKF